MKAKFRAIVQSGELRFTCPERFQNALRGLEGRDVEVSVNIYRKGRTSQQNRYYWGVVVDMLSGEIGYSREEMHEVLLDEHGLRKDLPNGSQRVMRSTEYTTVEFEEYLSKIRQCYAQRGYYLPLPGEVVIPDQYFTT